MYFPLFFLLRSDVAFLYSYIKAQPLFFIEKRNKTKFEPLLPAMESVMLNQISNYRI